LVLKELADNGLDTGAIVTVGEIADPERLGYFIDDRGSGLDPDEVAEPFSIGRPLMSTKLLRLPTRGALGNGLRVVAGAVLASDGLLIVTTRDVRLELRPERDGSTSILSRTKVARPVGTRVEIGFGPALPEDANAPLWAKVAIHLAQGTGYAGQSSRTSRLELQQAALYREGRRAGGAEAGPLARAVVEGLLDPRGARPDRQAGRARRADRGVLRP
jgi:hypothetical protein